MKVITKHVMSSVLVVDQNCWLLFARLVCLLLPARCLITVNGICCGLILYFMQKKNYFHIHYIAFWG